MSDYARIIDTDLGQVLIMIDTNDDDKIEIKFYFKCAGLGLSSVGAVMKDDSYDSAVKIMNEATKESVEGMVKSVLKEMNLEEEL